MNSEKVKDTKTFKRVVHMDEKVIAPDDKVGSAPVIGNDSTIDLDDTSVPSRPGGLSKSIIGRPRVYDLQGNLLASEENLVVLTGREFLAQVLANRQGDNPQNLTEYRVEYFGVGEGGSTESCPPVTTGPFDDDTDLKRRVVIKDGLTPDYINGGELKRIVSDGEIKIVSEEHTINVPTGGEKVVDKYTAVRYRMYLQPEEPKNKPFRFNEAGLFAVRYVWNPDINTWLPEENTEVLFARFTTLDKYLDAGDGLMIEWYVLV